MKAAPLSKEPWAIRALQSSSKAAAVSPPPRSRAAGGAAGGAAGARAAALVLACTALALASAPRLRSAPAAAAWVAAAPPPPPAEPRAPPPPFGWCVTRADVAASGRHRIFVAATVHDAAPLLPAFFESLGGQDYPLELVTAVVYDDASADGSAAVAAAAGAAARLGGVVVLRGARRRGPAAAKWELIRALRGYNGAPGLAAPNDLVLWLDGDDALFRPGVLAEVDAAFRARKPWFAWGRIRGYFEEQCGPPPVASIKRVARGGGAGGAGVPKTSTVRRAPWAYCHPRVMRAHLLGRYREADFRVLPGFRAAAAAARAAHKRGGGAAANASAALLRAAAAGLAGAGAARGGRWLQKYTDRQLVYKALELAGDARVAFLDGGAAGPHVLYRVTPASTLRLPARRIAEDRAYAEALPAEKAAKADVHAVMCVFSRLPLLRLSLDTNFGPRQRGLAGAAVVLHVCNNAGPAAEPEVRAALADAAGLAGYRLRTFADNPGGFARFVMMRAAAAEFPVDYFAMLDDDVLLPPRTGLAALLAAAAPREYNSWWGRHFRPGGDYFSSTLAPADLKAGTGRVDKFHYAGTGLSVVDADIVRFHWHLLEKIPERYCFVEDLWLSYVAHQLGWRVGRVRLAGVGFLEDPDLNANATSRAAVEATALWRSLAGVKPRMLRDLRACGWNV